MQTLVVEEARFLAGSQEQLPAPEASTRIAAAMTLFEFDASGSNAAVNLRCS